MFVFFFSRGSKFNFDAMDRVDREIFQFLNEVQHLTPIVSICKHVPTLFSFKFKQVYAVTTICEEIRLGSCWCMHLIGGHISP
jgi:hypothetical protein